MSKEVSSMSKESAIDPETLKRLKREAVIKSKEDQFLRKKKADEEKKRQQLAQLRKDYEEQEHRRVEEQLKALRRKTELRAKQKELIAKLNALREENIKKRYAAWRKKADAAIQEILQAQMAEEERLREALDAARDVKRMKESEKKEKIAAARSKNETLEINRATKVDARETERNARSLRSVDALKNEVLEELQSFLQNPFPVPLRQVLAGRLRPVPTVTELLAALKDQKEDLKQLEDQDIPTRAALRNQSIFQYIRDIQMKAEADRVKPPEPLASDMGRARGGGSQSARGRGSPTRNKSNSPSRRR